MTLFFSILKTLSYIYGACFIGFVSGKKIVINLKRLSMANEYFLAPVFIFCSVVLLDFDLTALRLPFCAVILMSLVATIGWKGAHFLGQDDKQSSLVGLCGALGNSANFGIPIVTLFMGASYIPLYSLLIISNILFTATYGYYIASRGQYGVRDAFIYVCRLPLIYALMIAVVLKLFFPVVAIALIDMINLFWDFFLFGLIAYGLFVIGVAFSGMKKHDFNLSFQWSVLVMRFIISPLMMALFIIVDVYILGWFDADIYSLLVIFSLLPTAKKIIMMASLLEIQPSKAAAAILITTLVASILMPLIFLTFKAIGVLSF